MPWKGTDVMNSILNTAIPLFAFAVLYHTTHVDSVADDYMASRCGQIIYETRDAAGSIDSQRGFYYTNFESCIIMIQVNYGRRILLTFEYLEIEKFGIMCPDYLHIYDGDTVLDTRLSPEVGFCGDVTPDTITSSGNQVTLKFVTDADTVKRGFFIVYTSFTEGGLCDGVDDFRCKNGRCIASRLENDWTDNCGDNSDEYETTAKALDFFGKIMALGVGIIIAITIGVVLLCVVCCIGCYCCFCKKRSPTRTTTITTVQPTSTVTTTVTAQQGMVQPPPPAGVTRHHIAPIPGQPASPAYPSLQQGPYGGQSTVTYHAAQPDNVGLPSDKQ
ncbi:low-density lipoprotein receptor-related protein 12-like [Ptychodera flava]|uniref:low-density lipoprotein receptor-related protein 12-like n=1 Tax=Ptychodera flava TaxID=63121 RepID=UPI00396A519B